MKNTSQILKISFIISIIFFFLAVSFFLFKFFLHFQKIEEKIFSIEEKILDLNNSQNKNLQLTDYNLQAIKNFDKNLVSLQEYLNKENINLKNTLKNNQANILNLQNNLDKEKQITNLLKNSVAVLDKKTDFNKINSDVLNNWTKRVWQIKCFKENEKLNKSGSGVFIDENLAKKFGQDREFILSNEHVLYDDGKFLENCKAYSNSGEVYQIEQEITKDFDKDYALAFLDKKVKQESSFNYNFCSKAEIGKKVFVLGFPRIGSEDSITVTEGIISSFEDGHYITSAKITKGNSGGAAILSDKNCLLGLPTFVKLDVTGALGRVLDINYILEDF